MVKSKKRGKQPEPPRLSHKERLAQKRAAREKQQKVMTTIAVGLFLGVLCGLPLAILTEPKFGLAIAMIVPMLLFSFQYPRLAVWAFLIYMPFSGTVTYWIGGGNAAFQLAKDAFYIPALLGLLLECQRKNRPILVENKLLPTLGLLFFASLLTLFIVNGSQEFLPDCSSLSERFLRNPDGSYLLDSQGIVISIPCRSGSPFLHGVAGLKVLLGYIPLIFCAYYLLEDKKQLVFLGRLLLVLAIICCVLGLIQYSFLESGRCVGTRGAVGGDLFRPSLEGRCFVGGALLYSPSQGQIRLPGTFVSPWHWAWFLVANGAVCFATAFSDPSFRWRIGGLAGMALIFMNAVISGQRLALALVPGIIVALLFLTGQVTNLKRFIPIGIGLALVLGIVAVNNPDIVQSRVDSFVARWNASPPHLFIQNQLAYAAENQRGILGRGLGKATNSTRLFGEVALIETFHAKLLYEIGYAGLIAFLVFVAHLSYVTYTKQRSVHESTLRSYGSSFWVFILIISFFPYWYPLDTDPVAVYYWFFAGVVLKLPALERQEQLKVIQEKIPQATRRGLKKFRRRAAYRPST
ncbi:MAG: hormogonium polysaccharide biosynthesis protein HpsL [Cyanophyceae cyanobacterium]